MALINDTLENRVSDFTLPPETFIAEMLKRTFRNHTCPVLIAIGGAGGIGKSTFSRQLALKLEDAAILELDEYKTCRSLRKEKKIFGAHPEANEMELISEHLAMIKSNLSIDKPVYCSQIGRADLTEKYYPKQFNIVEGEVATYKDFKDIIDFHIYIDSALTTQLKTRLTRDIQHKGYTRDKAFATFFGSNLIEFSEYGRHTQSWADIILFCDSNYALSLQEVISK